MKSEEIDNMIDAMSKEIEDLEETIEVSLKEQKEREKYTHELESKVQKLEAKLKKCKNELIESIQKEFESFTSHDNKFNLGDMQLLEENIIDKINEKVGKENADDI